ncbi:MAG TPA: sulfite exporter TauE/SafE family protein [Gemmatimonadaceae bacterium]|nr:sulfite exporter TauE/SafE family protein [Gemmatimonadaceae bacterium]
MLQSTVQTGSVERDALFVALGLFTVYHIVMLVRAARRLRAETGEASRPTIGGLATGFLANFLDTLGIGSFATETAIFRKWRLVRDERIPGTLNVANTLPTIAEAFIFTGLVPVGARTLIGMIAAAILGAWLGAGFVSRWPRRRIQIGMALTLATLAAIFVWRMIGNPSGGNLLELNGTLLVVGLIGNFMLGALMTIGLGLYAPCMILVSLLGMDPKAAFPIMMGSCAFLMPIASARFVRARAFDLRASAGVILGGIPGAIIAGLFVKSLPTRAVEVIVVLVALYAAAGLVRAARRESSQPTDASVAEAQSAA